MQISRSLILEWWNFRNSEAGNDDRAYLRIGQSFHNYFNLNKIAGQDRDFCDKLHAADGYAAKEMIDLVTDWQN